MNYQKAGNMPGNSHDIITALQCRVAVLEAQLTQAQHDKRIADETVRHVLGLMAEQQAQMAAKRGGGDMEKMHQIGDLLMAVHNMVATLNARANGVEVGALNRNPSINGVHYLDSSGAHGESSNGIGTGISNGNYNVQGMEHPDSSGAHEGSSSGGTVRTVVNLMDIESSRGNMNSGAVNSQAASERGDNISLASLVVDQSSSAASPWIENQVLQKAPRVAPAPIVHRTYFTGPKNPGLDHLDQGTAYNPNGGLAHGHVGGGHFDMDANNAPESSHRAGKSAVIEGGDTSRDIKPSRYKIGPYAKYAFYDILYPTKAPFAAIFATPEARNIASQNTTNGDDLPSNSPRFENYGLCYRPFNPTDYIYSTVIITNIDPEYGAPELLDQIRGGSIFKVVLLDTKALMRQTVSTTRLPVLSVERTLSALVTFCKGDDAQLYVGHVQNNYIMLGENRLWAELVETPTYPLHVMVSTARGVQLRPLQDSDSRSLKVKGFRYDRCTMQELKAIINMRAQSNTWASIRLDDDENLWLHFTSIQAAQFAFEQLNSKALFRGCKVLVMPDPCAGPLEDMVNSGPDKGKHVMHSSREGADHVTCLENMGESSGGNVQVGGSEDEEADVHACKG